MGFPPPGRHGYNAGMGAGRKKLPAWHQVAAAIVAALILGPMMYAASLWPVIRWGVKRQPAKGTEMVFVTHFGSRELPPSAPQFYWPIGWAAKHGNRSLRSAIIWYATSNYDMAVYLPTDRNGRYELV